MPTPLDGFGGYLKVGVTPTAVAYLTQFEYTVKSDIKTQGPYIGDANKTKVRAGKDITFSGEGVIVASNDAGQVLLHTAINTDANIAIHWQGGNSNTLLDITTAILTSMKVTHKGTEGVTFTFDGESSGSYTETFT
jgi:hypothetical protein